MGKLNIAHHKSYHPYKAENIEKVRRDEERAAAQAAGDQLRVMQADSQARIALLRKKAKKGKSKEEDQAEKMLERQLKGEKGQGRDDDANMEAMERPAEPVAKPSSESVSNITTKEGHCEGLKISTADTNKSLKRPPAVNFFADLEKSTSGPLAGRAKRNAEHEAEKKAEQDKWDRQITMYLEAPPKTWYDSKDRLKPTERVRTADQQIERAYKDNEMKRVEDPLAMMQAYLKRRDEVKAAENRAKANPWDDTPRTLTVDRTPVSTSLLSKRRDRNRRDRRSPSAEVEQEGPAKPPAAQPQQEAKSIRAVAQARESSERDRAKALLAARRQANGSVSSTPRSEFGYQTGMYNRNETRNAKGYSRVRWDEDRRGR